MQPTGTTWIGVDATRATRPLRAAAEAGARILRVTGPASGERLVRFHVVAASPENEEALGLLLEPLLPIDRLHAGQWRLERRGELDMMRQATGLVWWVVLEGDLAEQHKPGGPGPGGTPIAARAAAA